MDLCNDTYIWYYNNIFLYGTKPALWQVPVALICSMILGGFLLLGVEKICMNKNIPCGYTWGDGYFVNI